MSSTLATMDLDTGENSIFTLYFYFLMKFQRASSCQLYFIVPRMLRHVVCLAHINSVVRTDPGAEAEDHDIRGTYNAASILSACGEPYASSLLSLIMGTLHPILKVSVLRLMQDTQPQIFRAYHIKLLNV
jgi:hypothetical protein